MMASAEHSESALVSTHRDDDRICKMEESFQEINVIVDQIEDEQIETVLYYCDELLEMNPTDIMTLYSKGKVLFRQGYYSQAITVLKEVLALFPESKTIQQDLDLAMQGLVDLHKSQGERKNKTASNNTLQKKISFSWKWLIGGAVVALGGVAASARLSSWK